jgi:Cdc6-like AAA superfamily ATPase
MFVGWTAQIIKKKFKEAKGGVLFIDEAYSLVDGHKGSYGDEAINTIVQEMENNRNDLVVIFAGYPTEMEQFLDRNPGLRSRIAFHVPFDDYDSDELCDIARLTAKKDGLKLTDDAYEKLHGIFDTARLENDFGNGRYVRNILDKAKMTQATRLIELDPDSVCKEDLITICAEDIEMPEVCLKNTKHPIGFST